MALSQHFPCLCMAMLQHQGLVMKEELKRMKRVLRRLGFINADNVLTVKVGTSSMRRDAVWSGHASD